MNYIKHLNHWMELVDVDDRLSAYHISLYLSLFQIWNKSRFPDKIVISRNELYRLSKIGSSKTYYKCLHQLHEFGYIRYYPSNNALKGSTVALINLSDQDHDDQRIIDSDSPESLDDCPAGLAKNFCDPTTTTQVLAEHNQPKSCGKNDTCGNQVVTPFYLNNINLINGKHRKRGAREHFPDLKNEIKKISKGADEKKKGVGDFPSYYSTVASCLVRSKSKSSGSRFSNPSLDQVKAFFVSLDAREISPVFKSRKDLELEAIKFFHHYEANGWLVGGRSPMRNWLAAGMSWMAKAPYFNRKSYPAEKPNPLHVDVNQQYGKPL